MTVRSAGCCALLAAACAALAAPAVGAQQGTDAAMPLPPGASHERALEAQAGADTHVLGIYRVGAPVEMLLNWYLRRFKAAEDATPDTADLQAGQTTPVSYHLTYHEFRDQCADPGASPPPSGDAAASCKHWRRGADKRRALANSRVALEDGKWIERFTLTWFSRGGTGELVRRHIEVRDTGLSDNWQHDQLRSQVTLEREVMAAGQ